MKIKSLRHCLNMRKLKLYVALSLCLIAGKVWAGDINLRHETSGDVFLSVNSEAKDPGKTFLYDGKKTIFFQVQPIIVAGKVISGDDNQSLPGVYVTIKGTTQGTVTDANGTYKIEVPSEESILVFSFVGFVNQEVTVNNRSDINITLMPDVTSLAEVVVVGYGTQEKVNVTGAVATVKSTDLVKVPSPNISEVLVGKVPGLFSNQSQGVPGADYANLSIRGFGEPLVLVDGIQTSWTRLGPNEI